MEFQSHVTSHRSNSQQFQMAPNFSSVSSCSTIGVQLSSNLKPMRIREYMYFSLVMDTLGVFNLVPGDGELFFGGGTGYGRMRISGGQSKRDRSNMEKLLSPQ